MPWTLRILKPVERKLRLLTPKDQRLVLAALDELRRDPYSAALQPLKNQPTAFRLRVGNWRLPTDIYADELL
jgi:mRNA-degrading endonuclease RelE of RelBE toxin-antitoxin system